MMTIDYVDNFQHEIPDVHGQQTITEISADARDRTSSAGSSWRRRRPSGRSGGWPVLTLIALVVGGLSSLSGYLTQSSTAAARASVTSVSSIKCATRPATGAGANITLPNVVAKNAKTASQQLTQLGLTNVELSPANSKYHIVIVASNWTVVSTSPAPCTVLNSGDHVVLNVTKSSGGLRTVFEYPLSRFGQHD